MADVEITLGFTTAQAQALVPMIKAEADMAAHGFESVDDMTVQQQAKMCLYAWLMFKQQQHKRREAELTYGETAAQTVEDEFPIEVD